MPLRNSLYNVFEAKRHAEAVGSVGKKTFLAVIGNGLDLALTSIEIDTQLDAWYNEFGPKKLPPELEFKGPLYFKRKTQQA